MPTTNLCWDFYIICAVRFICEIKHSLCSKNLERKNLLSILQNRQNQSYSDQNFYSNNFIVSAWPRGDTDGLPPAPPQFGPRLAVKVVKIGWESFSGRVWIGLNFYRLSYSLHICSGGCVIWIKYLKNCLAAGVPQFVLRELTWLSRLYRISYGSLLTLGSQLRSWLK